jgi:Fe-S-cluster-containing dehydrogenase component
MDCIEACPFGVMQFDSEKGIAEKCHLCYHRIDRGERPACVDKCIGRCIYFGTIEELLAQLGNKRWKFGEESQ